MATSHQGPKLLKLRPAYTSLFDEALARPELWPPALHADVAVWAVVAVAHPQLTKPEHTLTAATFSPAAARLLAALRAMLAAKAAGNEAAGGTLRPLVMSQTFELVELLSGMWKQHEWAREQAIQALQLAGQLAAKGVFPKEQRGAIERAMSVMRARGAL